MGVGVKSGPGAARTILLFHTISAMPPKQPRMYVPSLRYTRGLGWRMHSVHCGVEVTETSTNKQHHLSCHNDEQDRLAPARLGREQFGGGKIMFVPTLVSPSLLGGADSVMMSAELLEQGVEPCRWGEGGRRRSSGEESCG